MCVCVCDLCCSDALAKDVMATCDYVESLGGPCVSVGRRWREHIAEGRWELKEVFYWAQPQPFWDMPAEVTTDLQQSAMVFVKGDANYRRLLGDCEWELTTPFATVRRVRAYVVVAGVNTARPHPGADRDHTQEPPGGCRRCYLAQRLWIRLHGRTHRVAHSHTSAANLGCRASLNLPGRFSFLPPNTFGSELTDITERCRWRATSRPRSARFARSRRACPRRALAALPSASPAGLGFAVGLVSTAS